MDAYLANDGVAGKSVSVLDQGTLGGLLSSDLEHGAPGASEQASVGVMK